MRTRGGLAVLLLLPTTEAEIACGGGLPCSRRSQAPFTQPIPPPTHPACLQVKRVYMKANLVVHPDKVKQKGGSLEQVATADMVFDVLKGAWGKFEAANR